MAIIGEHFPTPSPEASASYDFQDVEEGIGFVSFKAATTSGSYLLTRRNVYSNTIGTYDDALTAGHTKEIDLDFDTAPFNLPRVVKGTAFISVPFAVQTTGGGTKTEGYTIVDIKHWNGTTETSLGRSTSGSQYLSPAAGGQAFSGSQLHKIALTQKVFKEGDQLRLTVEAYCVQSGAGMEVGHDPQNRNSTSLLTSGPTELIADIPFKIDL